MRYANFNDERPMNKKEVEEFKELERELATESKPVEPEKLVEVKPSVSMPTKKGILNRLANFKKDPEPDGYVMDVLSAGADVIILGSAKDYYEVEYRDHHGYIKKNCVTEKR